MKRIVRGRTRELAVGDQLLQRPRHFENGDTTAGVVVGARPLMVEMTRIGDLIISVRAPSIVAVTTS